METSANPSQAPGARSLLDTLLLYATIGLLWPLSCAGVGAVVGVPTAFLIPVFTEGEELGEVAQLIPVAVFYGSAAGAAIGAVVGLAVALITATRRRDTAGQVRAVRLVGTWVAIGLFLVAAAAFNDSFDERVAFVALYGLPTLLGIWLGWRIVPTVVHTYEHRLH